MREVHHAEGHTWQRTSVVDEEAIDHERIIAQVQATGEMVQVRVAQRVDFDLLADPVTVLVSPPRTTVGMYIEMSGPQAGELGDGLRAAGRFASEVDCDPAPALHRILTIDLPAGRPLNIVADRIPVTAGTSNNSWDSLFGSGSAVYLCETGVPECRRRGWGP
jgi:hypothetical protein